MNQTTLLNPNTAETDELRTLPGIGPALAERIQAARPFADAQDLLRVTGISPALLEKIQDLLVFDTSEPPETANDRVEESIETAVDDEILISEAELEEALVMEPLADAEAVSDESITDKETQEDVEPPTAAEPASTPAPAKPAPTPAKTPNYITRGQAFWMSITVAFFTFILAVALTLSVLSALNNGLRFASPTQVRDLQTSVRDLQTQSGTINDDLTALRTRMDNFEALGGRVTTLETTLGTVEEDVESISGDIVLLNSDIAAVSESVETIRTDTTRFQVFLDGLSELLLGLSPEGKNE